MALDAASLRIMAAPGCYGGPHPPVYGWVLTIEAAKALARTATHMPDGSSHHRLDYDEYPCATDALGKYLEAVSRDPSDAGRQNALKEYQSSRRAALPSATEDEMTETKMTVVSADFATHGYNPEATLLIQPSRGRYVVYLRLNTPDSEEREVAWEPAEPDRQKLGISVALADPMSVILDAIRIDTWRREEE